MLYLLLMILGIVCLASVVPGCQYVYYRFIKKENKILKYYFSEDLFNGHQKEESIPYSKFETRVINNREEMQKLWDDEMKYKLP